MRTLLVLISSTLCLAGLHAASVSGQIYVDDIGNDGVTDTTIDYYAFDVTAGTSLVFDVLAREDGGVDFNGDGSFGYLDSELFLYNSTDMNNVLTSNDDYFGADTNGSSSILDSYMTYTFSQAGTYVLAIGDFNLTHDDVLLGYNPGTNITGPGTYRIDILTRNGSLSNIRQINNPPVPEPGTIALGLCAAGGVWLRKRRKAKV